MKEQPVLTEAEWAMVQALVRNELEGLPTEIHHTQRADYRRQLEQRRHALEQLAEKLAGAAVG